jgi:hypothetical protein
MDRPPPCCCPCAVSASHLVKNMDSTICLLYNCTVSGSF